MLDTDNVDLVHHFDFLECDPSAVFDDDALPQGSCDESIDKIRLCVSNFATAWAVGGNLVSSINEMISNTKRSIRSLNIHLKRVYPLEVLIKRSII